MKFYNFKILLELEGLAKIVCSKIFLFLIKPAQEPHDLLHKFGSLELTSVQRPKLAHTLQVACESWQDDTVLHRPHEFGQ